MKNCIHASLIFALALLLFCQVPVNKKSSAPSTEQSREKKNSLASKKLSRKTDVNIEKPKLYIELFHNQNNAAGLNARLRQILAQEFSFDGRLDVAQEKYQSDFILSGKIDSYFAVPIAYEPQTNATRYQMSIVAIVALTTNELKSYPHNTEDLIEGNRMARHEKFYSSDTSNQISYHKEEELLRGLSKRIVHVSLDNWFLTWQRKWLEEK